MLLSKYVPALLIVLTSLGAFASPVQDNFKGFREWKSEKVQAVLTQVVLTKAQLSRAKTDSNIKNFKPLERQLAQDEWNLEVAKDLSVTDYFILYLTQQPQKDRFLKAASKLTPIEVAELMEAYSKTLSSGGTELPTEKEGVQLPSQATKGTP